MGIINRRVFSAVCGVVLFIFYFIFNGNSVSKAQIRTGKGGAQPTVKTESNKQKQAKKLIRRKNPKNSNGSVAVTPSASKDTKNSKEREAPFSLGEKAISVQNSPSPGAIFNTGDNATIVQGATPWTLTLQQQTQFRAKLKAGATGVVEIFCEQADQDSCNVALILKNALESAGWSVKFQPAMHFTTGEPKKGIYLYSPKEPPIQANALLGAFQAANIFVEAYATREPGSVLEIDVRNKPKDD